MPQKDRELNEEDMVHIGSKLSKENLDKLDTLVWLTDPQTGRSAYVRSVLQAHIAEQFSGEDAKYMKEQQALFLKKKK